MNDMLRDVDQLNDGEAKELLDLLLHRFEYVAVNRKVFHGDDPPPIVAMKSWCWTNSYVPVQIEEYEHLKTCDEQLTALRSCTSIDQLAAAEQTMQTVEDLLKTTVWSCNFSSKDGFSLQHLRGMLKEMRKENFSEGKMGRWLGWMQAAVAMSTHLTLDDMKNINKGFKREKSDS